MKKGIEYLSSNLKREFDIVGGVAVAAAVLPVGLVAGITSALDTHSTNPFFMQERVGKNNAPFMALKFRSIAKTAIGEESYGTFDPRATKVEQTLRQTGLDELPQIYNVIRGSMSLVGARPMLEADIDFFIFLVM